MKGFVLALLFFYSVTITNGRIHTATLTNDRRNLVALSSFGYFKNGSLLINITSLQIPKGVKKSYSKVIGFTLDKSSSSGTSVYTEKEENSRGCILTSKDFALDDVPRAIFTFFEEASGWVMQIRRHKLDNLTFYQNREAYEAGIPKPTSPPHKTIARKTASNKIDDDGAESADSRKKRTTEETEVVPETVPVKTWTNTDGDVFLSTTIFMYIDSVEDEGYYELYFHNCNNTGQSADKGLPVSVTIKIEEQNLNSYLSAGDMALPAMYGLMSCVFFITGVFWFLVICSNKGQVFTIHYLMGILMIVKALSIMFHAIDYYFIGRDGRPEAWAVIFYIVHLLKGILLFICLLLIGTGWAFIKYVLSNREKKVFMIVIPLQVITNVAYIIIEGTDEDSKSYDMWKDTMILLDLLCCGAILVPVIWSVRHLQEASQTDGKAAANLAKLRLFQQFYVLVICYLYCTRIIVYLLEITLPFQFIWIHLLFSEVGTYIFFVVTGYKFRPGCDNPYLRVSQDDDDEIESEALTKSGATETVFKVNQHEKDVLDTDEQDMLLPLRQNQSSFV
uniref:Protein GPR107-like n=1 Tax=Phallusia mammillata TaxID=59560 RepID=A0A6F9DEK3_9ASCI|nr:protein GPR107-like [Phallusia mammillata]